MPKPMPEWRDVDRRTFQAEIEPLRQPAVLRGLVAHWPLVQKSLEGPVAAYEYLRVFNAGSEVEYLAGMPDIKGRFFYNEAMNGENFVRHRGPFQHALRLVLEAASVPDPPFVSIQAVPVPLHLPDLELRHTLDLADGGARPALWIDNAVTLAPRFDCKDNIACVVAGRRRFIVFPPEQVANLYVGPLHSTPQGVPVSMVDVESPDLARHPRYAAALGQAYEAELEPGDAVYIPTLWWHGVRSLVPFNMAMNYGWDIAPRADGPPFTALMHALLAVGSLPPPLRESWRALFEHFVFRAQGDPAEHLPPEARGLLGPMPPALRDAFMAKLLQVMVSELPRTQAVDAARTGQRP
jgi:hypothetical protein